MQKNKNHKLLVILTFSMMIVFGIIINLKSQINPLIQQDYNINNAQLSLVVVAFSLGGMLISLFSGRFVERFNLKRLLFGGLLIAALNLVAMSYINSYKVLIIIMLLTGFGVTTLNVVGNTLASQVFVQNRGRMMNLFHLFFGIGGYIAPYYANQIFKLGFEWEQTYSFGIILLFYIIIFSIFCKFPRAKIEETEVELTTAELLKDPRVIIFALMFISNVGAEVGIISWLGVYLDQIYQMNKLMIGYYVSWFFGLFTLGRLTASLFVEKVGYLRWVLFSVIGAIVSITLALFGPDSFAIFFSITGFFVASNFPNIQAAMFGVFEKNLSAVIGLTLAAGELGNLIFANLLIGKVNDLFSVKLGYMIFIAYLVILASLTLYMQQTYIEKND